MKRDHVPDVERTLYRPVEVAQRWGVDRTTVYRMADDGRLKTVSTPFGLRIHQDEILRIEGDGAVEAADGSPVELPAHRQGRL